MRIAYRLFIAATLLTLAYGVGTASMHVHPWFIIAPLVMLGIVGAVRYRGE